MRLDRNINEDGKGKYALIKLRDIKESPLTVEALIRAIEEKPEIVDFGAEDEFFVLRLKDIYAPAALIAYAQGAMKDDVEWGAEIMDLAYKAIALPDTKIPD